MSSSFSTALSALNAHAAAISVVGDNLANMNTTAFKANSVSFHDLVAGAMGVDPDNQIGSGVSEITTKKMFTQGSVQVTSGALDAAIEGDGFFLLHDQQGVKSYGRSGSFKINSSGYLVTASGNRVQGWSGQSGAVDVNSATGDIQLPENLKYAPKATSKVSLGLNLNASAVTGESTGSFTAPIEVYDSWGSAHQLSVTFTKKGAGAWDYAVNIPASELASAGTTAPPPLAQGSLEFDANGLLKTPAADADPIAVPVTGLANGAADINFTWQLYGTDKQPLLTQYAQVSSVSSVDQDGAAPGELSSLGFADGGGLVARFTNGKQQTVAQIAMAVFQNPDSLIDAGDGKFYVGVDTSSPAVGLPGSGGRGQIAAGALESSTVDMAKEFTNLIVYQRGYQANSRVITTLDELSQETLSLKR